MMSCEFFFKIVLVYPNNSVKGFKMKRALGFYFKNKNMTTMRMYQTKYIFMLDF